MKSRTESNGSSALDFEFVHNPFGPLGRTVTSPQKGNRSFTPDFPRFEVRSKVYENISIYVIIALLVTHARDP